VTSLLFSFDIKKIKSYLRTNCSANSLSKSCSGVSPVIATTIILAITITLGLSLWSFANSGVGAATATYANVVTEYGQFTNDSFVITSVAFNNPSNQHVAVWIYNSGGFTTNINNIAITCKDCTNFNIVTKSDVEIDGSNEILSKDLEKLSVSTDGQTLEPGRTYVIQVISTTGAMQEFFQKN
jgi:hypothetical protein